ncbi:MAG: T9SS type A sorting domain-containing protein [Flavobacteriales bacterium]|nr:T9SS type A sorting domain-containing protein [Flavobacteriales bacterium]
MITKGIFGQTSLVFDIVPGNTGADPSYLYVYNNELYFNANELWKTNEDTTFQVSDINPFSYSYPQNFFEYDSLLYFVANDGMNGYELWVTDGATSFLVHDINPNGDSYINYFVEYNSELFFQAYDDINGLELWKFNGDTVLLAQDINPGISNSNPHDFVVLNGTLFFVANNGVNGEELWSYDGSTFQMVSDLWNGSNSSSPKFLTSLNSELFFQANDSIHGKELFKYTGDSIVLVADIYPGDSSSTPQNFMVFNAELFFNAGYYSFYKTDGSSVVYLANIEVNSGSGSIIYNSELYFASGGYSPTPNLELWKTDGNSVNMVDDINPAGSSTPKSFNIINGELYFTAFDNVNGRELRKTSGDSCYLVQDINPGIADAFNWLGNEYFAILNNNLYFVAEDTIYGNELRKLTLCDTIYTNYSINICSNDSVIIGNNIYNTVGVYNDTLVSYLGCDSIVTTSVSVDSSLIASFYSYLDPMDSLNLIVVNDSQGDNLIYYWDFGDGNSSNQPYPTHLYSSLGVYNLCLTITDSMTGCISTYCDSTINNKMNGIISVSVIPSIPTSSHLYSLDVKHNVYPNPNSGSFNISGDILGSKIEVFNGLGQMVYNNSKLIENTLSIEGLSKGVYFLKVQNNNFIKTYKVIVE